jgi:hypothetical protein
VIVINGVFIPPRQPYDRWDHMDGWGGWMWLGCLIWLIILAGLIGLGVWLGIRAASQSSALPQTDARRILANASPVVRSTSTNTVAVLTCCGAPSPLPGVGRP